MSFYVHPSIFAQAQQAQQPQAQRLQQVQQVQRQSRTPALLDLENEERTALAYLRSVQRRREAAEAAAALEARHRAVAAARQQQALRAAAEEQAALIAAARRERAIRVALEREQEREQALAAALQQRRRDAILRSVAAEQERQAKAFHAYQAAIAQCRAQQEQEFRARQLQAQAQAGCAKANCCRRAPSSAPTAPTAPVPATTAVPVETKTDGDDEIDLAGINSLLGSLFGFQIAPGDLDALRAEQELPEKDAAPTATEPEVPRAEPESDVTDKVTRDLEAFAEAAAAVENEAETSESAPAARVSTAPAATVEDDADPAETPLNAAAPAFVPAHTEDASASPSAPAPAPAAQLPGGLNQLLNAFLGLQVDPAADGEQAHGKVVGDAVVNLNDLLARYGLEFVADEAAAAEAEAEPKAEATASAPVPDVEVEELPETSGAPAPSEAPASAAAPERAASPVPAVPATPSVPAVPAAPVVVNKVEVPELATAPFTSTLDHHSNIPPQLRDILANVESAMNALEDDDAKPSEDDSAEKKRGYKKRRAPRERKPRAAEDAENATPERAAAFAKLDDIEGRLATLLGSFTFPAHLGFAASTPDRTQPPLLFNRVNTPYHAQAHDLLQLILAADGVQSDGDRAIRRRRKALVSRVEDAIAQLETRRDARWEEVRERRERGESDDEGEHTSSTELTDSEPEPEAEVEGFQLL